MHALAGLDTLTSGEVFVGDVDGGALKEKELTRLRRERIGFVFQSFNLIPVLSARENVELPLLVTGVAPKEAAERARDMLARVGLADRGDHRPGELSGGEQQRVTVARALVAEPALVWADEPTGALDSQTAGEIIELLFEVHATGQTLVVVTHDEALGRSGQRLVEVRDGSVVYDGQPMTDNVLASAQGTVS